MVGIFLVFKGHRIFATLAGESEATDTVMIPSRDLHANRCPATDATHLKAHRTAASLLKKGVFPAVSDGREAA